MDAQSWTVGELARATGVSVRVLRHWDELGLVSPARTASGHRRYGPAEVVLLYRAIALRRTGLRLERIGALLADSDPDPAATLRAHLAELEAELADRARLRDRLRDALAAADAAGADGRPAAPPLMTVIEAMTMLDGYVHAYRPRENDRLADQAARLADILHAGTAFPAGAGCWRWAAASARRPWNCCGAAPACGSRASTGRALHCPRRAGGSARRPVWTRRR